MTLGDDDHDPSVRCADTSPREAWGGEEDHARCTASPSAGIASPVFWRITVTRPPGVSTW